LPDFWAYLTLETGYFTVVELKNHVFKDKLLNQIIGGVIEGLEFSEKQAGVAANARWRISGRWFLAPTPMPRMKADYFRGVGVTCPWESYQVLIWGGGQVRPAFRVR
jgi:hypothetical protein